MQRLNLLRVLIFRDVKLRYAQSVGGIAWAVINPVMMMIVFSLFFGRVLKVDSLGIPYPIFSYAALLPWTLFSQGLSKGTGSLVSDQTLITKLPFPRMLLPLSASLSPLVDFAIALLVLAAMMAYYQVGLHPQVLAIIPFLLVTLILTFGLSLWLSSLNIEYRDIAYALPFVLQLGLIASPVAYSSGLVGGGWFQSVYLLNPMTGVLEGFRWSLLGVAPHPVAFISSGVISVAVLLTGIWFFRKRQDRFPDVV